MNDIIKQVNISLNYEEIKKDVLNIIKEYPELKQIGLTHSKNNLSEYEKITDCVGLLYDKHTKKIIKNETDFTEFNSKYKSTSLYSLYTSLPTIGRFRIMIMDGPSCYTFHKDQTFRYHFVIQTHEDALFLFPEQSKYIHIPQDGNLYIVDTRLTHSFINGAFEKRRIHLVLDQIGPLL